jgi:hypothetical protein
VKGGGCEGQYLKEKKGRNNGRHQNCSNQAQDNINDLLCNISYMSNDSKHMFSQNDWILNSGMTLHICTSKEAFIDYIPLKNATITGIGPEGIPALGRGTVAIIFKVAGQRIQHLL